MWLDEDEMFGYVRVRAHERRINSSDLVIMYLTDEYTDEIDQPDRRDNCKYEFDDVFHQKGNVRLLVAVGHGAALWSPRAWGDGVLGD